MGLQDQLQRTLGDGYTLERELAGGGMARVFVARDRGLDRLVVIKTLASEVAPAISAERFRREIRLAASLQQANIVPVHSTGEVDGVPYYTMPFVEGESLRARLKNEGALPLRDAVNIVRDVARALAFAHERGVVHRDIKPENILLSGNTAVVTDFGIAKAIEASQSQAGAPTLTHLGTVLGTPAYMSPEQAAGDSAIDHRADIYSLGVVAYELIAGTPPFTDRSAQALMVAHVSATPVALAERKQGVPGRLSALVMRCLEKDPARRPESATELLRALDGALATDGTPVAAFAAKPSVAVLPFANLSPDPADEFFADGLTDEIITDLAGISTLHVIARTAMMRYKGAEKEPADVARELKARYVLEGSVRRAGQSLRLSARLVDTADDVTLWSDKLNGVVEDVFDMQERVSRTIVEALKVKLTPREVSRLASRPIEDLKAYEAYLQARQAIWTFNPESLASAMQLIDTARGRIGENPRLLAAEALLHLSFIETGTDDAEPHLRAVARCADRLTEIDPESFSRHAVVGQLACRRGHIREAIASLSRALELEPSAGDVSIYLAIACVLAGQDSRAREIADRVVEIDPLTPLFQRAPGFCELMAGRPEAALPYYQRFADAEPANAIAQFLKLVVLAETDDRESTVNAAEHVARQFPNTVFGTIAALYARVALGRLLPSDVRISADVRAHSARSEMFARQLAILLARAGVDDAAMDALEDSIRLGLAHYPYLARNSRAFVNLRAHPRFRRILEVVRDRWERGGTSAEDLVAPLVVEAAASRPVIAVLPLNNMSASADDEYFADGMTEDIIAQLSQIASLRVISRTSAMGYKRSTRKPSEIASELGATHVIEGSVRRAGTRVRIVATLMRAPGDMHLWSETFDRDLTDIFAIQSELAQRIASALVARLTPAEMRQVAKRPTSDMDAYNLFLLGRQEYNRVSPEAFARAEEFYAQAIARDPGFARAYAAKALVDMYHGGGYWGVRPMVAYDRAVALARKALELDPHIGEAHMVLGSYESWIRFDWVASEKHFTHAIALNPSHAFTHIMHGWHLAAVGRLDAALDAAQRAVELDPAAILIHGNALSFYYLARQHDQFDAALAAARRLVSFEGVDIIVQTFEFIARGRAGEVLADLRPLARGSPNIFLRALHAWCAAAGGAEAEAREVLRELHALEQTMYVWPTGLALTYAHLGEPDKAFEYLERAYQDRAGWLNVLGCSPAFDIFRGDPRFGSMVKRVGVVVPPEMKSLSFKPMPVRSRVSAIGTQLPTDRPSVAVLPLANLSGSADDEYFADGMTDDIIAQLSKVASLKVISRTSVMRYKKTQEPATHIGATLGASHLLEGTVRRAGNRLRIVAQLIEAASDAHLWAETYDRELIDVFATQSEVATSVVAALKATLTPDERARIAKPPTRDIEAYDLYQLGRFQTGKWSPDGWQKGVALLQQAIARDAAYAAPHATLAINYAIRAYVGALPSTEAFAQAESEARLALALDRFDADAHLALAYVQYFLHWNWDAAGREFQEALAISPGNAHARSLYGTLLDSVGRHGEAMKERTAAQELSPVDSVTTFNVGYGHLIGRRYDDALKYFRRALEIEPRNIGATYGLGMTQIAANDAPAACRTFEAAVALGDMATASKGFLGWAYGAAGRTDDAERVLAELTAVRQDQYVSPYHFALVYQGLGRTDELFEWLERSFAERSMWMVWFHVTPTFDSVRRDPRFDSIVRRMGLPPDAGLPPEQALQV